MVIIMDQKIYEVRCPEIKKKNSLVKAMVPGSKSITNRALLLAAMAEGTSTLYNCQTSDDARHFMGCLKELGFSILSEPDHGLGSKITITGHGGDIPCKKATINVGSAGTAARFLSAMLAFSDGEYIVESSEQMKKRPMQPLIDSLRSAGAKVECMEEEGHFPLHIIGTGASRPNVLKVNIEKSSQFLSALLIAAGTFHHKTEIMVEGSHGLSYADLTVQMMEQFGVAATKQVQDGQIKYLLTGEKSYQAMDYAIEPDMSAAAYFYALAAVLGIGVVVEGVKPRMLQGDTQFLDVLTRMGCKSSETQESEVVVYGPDNGQLNGGFVVDMSSFSDQALTLAAIAPFADGPITITGIGHIRLQECDRIEAMVRNLTALGIETEEKQEEITIFPGVPKGCDIETYDDHRVAMSFVLTGLGTKGVRILNPECCKKTFAEYFDVLNNVLEQLS